MLQQGQGNPGGFAGAGRGLQQQGAAPGQGLQDGRQVRVDRQ